MRYALLLLVLVAPAQARDCSVSLGAAFSYSYGDEAGTVAAGCSLAGFDLRAHYVGSREITWEGIHYKAAAFPAFSAMRYWQLRKLHFGAGLFLKESEAGYENPWVPSPVSFIGAVGIHRGAWAVRVGHISNAKKRAPNWGQEFLHIERFW